MKPLKILFINYEYPPVGAGGGNANANIAKDLVAMGHDVHVMTGRFGDLPHREKKQGVDVIRIPTLRRRADKCTIFEMLVFLLSGLLWGLFWHRRLKPDVVGAFFSIPSGPVALLCRLLYRTPYVVALRGGDVPGFMPTDLWFYHKVTAWLNRLVWRGAFALTVNSRGLGDLANRFERHPNLNVIPNGVDQAFFSSKDSNASTVSTKKLKVLAVGRLSSQKRVDRLIESVIRLKKKGILDLELMIAGDGPLRKNLEDLALQGGVLDRQVRFLGWMDREHLIPCYRQADVFSLASDFEGMPNVVLEAMASGLAIVATSAPGTVDLVHHGENGYLVEPGQAKDFDRFFVDLLKDRAKLLRMQDQSRSMAREYTWSGVAKAYAKLSEQAREH